LTTKWLISIDIFVYSIFREPTTRRHYFRTWEEWFCPWFSCFMGKLSSFIVPQRERDTDTKQNTLLVLNLCQNWPDILFFFFFLSQNTNEECYSLHPSLISSAGSKDNCWQWECLSQIVGRKICTCMILLL